MIHYLPYGLSAPMFSSSLTSMAYRVPRTCVKLSTFLWSGQQQRSASLLNSFSRCSHRRQISTSCINCRKFNQPVSGNDLARCAGITSMMRLPVQNTTEGLSVRLSVCLSVCLTYWGAVNTEYYLSHGAVLH